MKQNAVVTQTFGDKADVTVLREEACSHCAGRVVCGTAKKYTITVKNPISAQKGDTVVIENSAERVLAYSFLVFLLPVLLGIAMYLIFIGIGLVICAVMTAIGFVLPLAVALIVDRRGRDERMPVITEKLEPSDNSPSCENGNFSG